MTGVDPFEERIQQNRIARNNRIYERQQIARRQRSPQEYVGYDAATGLHRLRGAEGDRLVSSITTGALEAGAIVRSGPGGVSGLEAARPFILPDKTKPLLYEKLTVWISDGTAIRRMEMPSGEVITVAGSEVEGGDDGPVETATFDFVDGIWSDNFTTYLADSGGCTIRKIEGGIVSTVAGSYEQFDQVDGVGSDARFQNVTGITVGWDGQIFVTETGDDRFAVIDPITTQVTTIPELSGNNLVPPDIFFDERDQVIWGEISGGTVLIKIYEDYTWSLFSLPVLNGFTYRAKGNTFIRQGNRLFFAVQIINGENALVQKGVASINVDGSGFRTEFTAPWTTSAEDYAGLFYFQKKLYLSWNKNSIFSAANLAQDFAGSRGNLGLVDGVRTDARFLYPLSMFSVTS